MLRKWKPIEDKKTYPRVPKQQTFSLSVQSFPPKHWQE